VTRSQQEIEEDKKKAEQEGIAVTTPRKPRPHEPETDRRRTEKENFTVTVDLSKPVGVRHDGAVLEELCGLLRQVLGAVISLPTTDLPADAAGLDLLLDLTQITRLKPVHKTISALR